MLVGDKYIYRLFKNPKIGIHLTKSKNRLIVSGAAVKDVAGALDDNVGQYDDDDDEFSISVRAVKKESSSNSSKIQKPKKQISEDEFDF